MHKLCALAALPVLLLPAACNKKADDTGNLKSAINTYYDAHPECLWRTPIQLPQQHGKDDAEKIQPLDALFDQGLLTRTPIEKTKLLILKENANSYDLSATGRSAWIADATQPGFGNFCYAHRRVQSIVSNTPAGTNIGATTTVNYTYDFSDAAAWAKAPETQNAFPQLRTNLNTLNTAQTTLVLTNSGWQLPTSR